MLCLRCYKPESFHFICGHYAWIKCKNIDSSWHPFYISSSPHEPTLSFHISVYDDWSQKLYDTYSVNFPSIEISGPNGRGRSTRYKEYVVFSFYFHTSILQFCCIYTEQECCIRKTNFFVVLV